MRRGGAARPSRARRQRAGCRPRAGRPGRPPPPGPRRPGGPGRRPSTAPGPARRRCRMAMTTGSMPTSTAATVLAVAAPTASQASTMLMRMAGRMKPVPAAKKPGQPARRRPMARASSLELGPGMTLVAATRSRKSWSSIQPRRRTSVSRKSPLCAAGPPKAVSPRRRKTTRTSRQVPDSCGHLRLDRLAVRPLGQWFPHW